MSVSRPYGTNTGTPGIVIEGIQVLGYLWVRIRNFTEFPGTGIENAPNVLLLCAGYTGIEKSTELNYSKCRVPV